MRRINKSKTDYDKPTSRIEQIIIVLLILALLYFFYAVGGPGQDWHQGKP